MSGSSKFNSTIVYSPSYLNRRHSQFTPWTSTLQSKFLPNHVAWPRYTWNVTACGLLFCTILFPNHISGLFSQGQDMSLPGTKQQSGVDGGYPAESAVRCNKLMANLTRRCCQAGRGGSCSTRDSLLLLHTLMWHGNLFQASLRRCLRALISPERWSMDRGGAETSCRWSPMDLSQQRGSAVNDCSQGWFHTSEGDNPRLQHMA